MFGLGGTSRVKVLTVALLVAGSSPAAPSTLYQRIAENTRCGAAFRTAAVSSLAACAAVCSRESGCVGFSLEASGGPQRTCEMTRTNSNHVSHQGFNFYLTTTVSKSTATITDAAVTTSTTAEPTTTSPGPSESPELTTTTSIGSTTVESTTAGSSSAGSSELSTTSLEPTTTTFVSTTTTTTLEPTTSVTTSTTDEPTSTGTSEPITTSEFTEVTTITTSASTQTSAPTTTQTSAPTTSTPVNSNSLACNSPNDLDLAVVGLTTSTNQKALEELHVREVTLTGSQVDGSGQGCPNDSVVMYSTCDISTYMCRVAGPGVLASGCQNQILDKWSVYCHTNMAVVRINKYSNSKVNSIKCCPVVGW